MANKGQYKYREVYLVDGNRTPFLKNRNRRGAFSAADLATDAARSLLVRQPFLANELDDVITGCVIPSENEANISRIVSLRIGCGHDVPAWTVQRNCASGMQAIDSGAQAINDGRAELVLAGGVECMSHAPLLHGPLMSDWLTQVLTSRSLAKTLQYLVQFRPHFLKPTFASVSYTHLTLPTIYSV